MIERKILFALAVATVAATPVYGIPWSVSTTLLSIIIVALAFLNLECKLAGSRTITLLAVLTAVAVVSRQALHAVGASPIFFIIILAGYCFGATPGFIVGAATMLVSNFTVAGHGPWTPYQMLAAGLVGYGAGLLPRPRGGRAKLAVLLAWGAASAFLYGAVTDVFWWLTFTREHTLTTYLAIHAAGTIVNVARAVGNAVFLLALGPPVLRVLERFRRRLRVEFIN